MLPNVIINLVGGVPLLDVAVTISKAPHESTTRFRKHHTMICVAFLLQDWQLLSSDNQCNGSSKNYINLRLVVAFTAHSRH